MERIINYNKFYHLIIVGVNIVGDSGVIGTGAAVLGGVPVGSDYPGGRGGVIGSGSGVVDKALTVSEQTITGGNTKYCSVLI